MLTRVAMLTRDKRLTVEQQVPSSIWCALRIARDGSWCTHYPVFNNCNFMQRAKLEKKRLGDKWYIIPLITVMRHGRSITADCLDWSAWRLQQQYCHSNRDDDYKQQRLVRDLSLFASFWLVHRAQSNLPFFLDLLYTKALRIGLIATGLETQNRSQTSIFDVYGT